MRSRAGARAARPSPAPAPPRSRPRARPGAAASRGPAHAEGRGRGEQSIREWGRGDGGRGCSNHKLEDEGRQKETMQFVMGRPTCLVGGVGGCDRNPALFLFHIWFAFPMFQWPSMLLSY